jgi:hypothetical protein
MAAKLRPRVMLPRPASSTAAALPKPAAVSFSGLLGGGPPELQGRFVLRRGSIAVATLEVGAVANWAAFSGLALAYKGLDASSVRAIQDDGMTSVECGR